MKKLFMAKVYHKRFLPKVNEFVYSGFYLRFSLENKTELNSIFFSVNRPNLFSFYDKDHGRKDQSSLMDWAKDVLEVAQVKNFNGKIVIQTFPRVLGYVFNPVSFWYCYENNDLKAIICEVNNTFGESHSYVLTKNPTIKNTVLNKEFHVSPFYPVQGSYEFDFKNENKVIIKYFDDDQLQFIAQLDGKEIKWSDSTLVKIFLQFPFYGFMVMFLIHWQALILFVKKIKFFKKPLKSSKEITFEY